MWMGDHVTSQIRQAIDSVQDLCIRVAMVVKLDGMPKLGEGGGRPAMVLEARSRELKRASPGREVPLDIVLGWPVLHPAFESAFVGCLPVICAFLRETVGRGCSCSSAAVSWILPAKVGVWQERITRPGAASLISAWCLPGELHTRTCIWTAQSRQGDVWWKWVRWIIHPGLDHLDSGLFAGAVWTSLHTLSGEQDTACRAGSREIDKSGY